MPSFVSFRIGLTLAVISIFLQGSLASAANTQSSLSFGLSFFNQTSSGSISQMGYALHFQVENREKWIRPTYGGQIEASFGTNTLIDGQMFGGVEVVAMSAPIAKPFLAANAAFGWATVHSSTATYVGIVYGIVLEAGTEIRFIDREKANALRISSGWRFLLGSLGGGVSGSDLNTLQVSLGVTF